MKKNIGTADRLWRLSIAIALMILSWWFHSWILLGCSLFTLYEALAGWCIVYSLLGKSSCPIQKK